MDKRGIDGKVGRAYLGWGEELKWEEETVTAKRCITKKGNIWRRAQVPAIEARRMLQVMSKTREATQWYNATDFVNKVVVTKRMFETMYSWSTVENKFEEYLQRKGFKKRRAQTIEKFMEADKLVEQFD